MVSQGAKAGGLVFVLGAASGCSFQQVRDGARDKWDDVGDRVFYFTHDVGKAMDKVATGIVEGLTPLRKPEPSPGRLPPKRPNTFYRGDMGWDAPQMEYEPPQNQQLKR